MTKMKLLGSVLLVLAVLFMQVGSAAAAPQTQDTTPVTGTVQNITIETDSTGASIVVVTLLDDQGATQTVNLSVDQAVALGLDGRYGINGAVCQHCIAEELWDARRMGWRTRGRRTERPLPCRVVHMRVP